MKKIIHHLRQKPEEARKHILNIFMLVIIVLLLVAWSFSLGKNIGSKDTQEKLKEDIKPFTILKDTIIDSYDGTKGLKNSNN